MKLGVRMSTKRFMKSTKVFYNLFLCFMLLLVCATYSHAATSAGYSDYYVPGDEVNMWTIFDTLDDAGTNYAMHSVISVTAWSANTTVYYDHWENGYTFDPENPAATADEVITLTNAGDQRIFESSNIPTNPRGTATYYDGGDRIYIAGGSVTITRASWIEAVGVGNQADAWEIYPVKPQLTTYVLPFGENLGFSDFNRVFVLIQATDDNTTFQVDLNGDGIYDNLNQNRDGDKTDAGDTNIVTLQRGQTFLLDRTSACLNGGTQCLTTPGNLNSGVFIQGNKTLQVKFVAGNPGQRYSARGFSAFPRGFWTKDYYAPLDQPTGGAGNTDYYLHNPNSAAITISWYSISTSGTFNIPANSTVSFRTASGGAVPVDSGLYFKGSDVFWGVGVSDAGSNAYEWGFSLLPSTMLYKEHYLGWAPGSIPVDTTGNPGNQDNDGVFLIAAQDNTRIWVDFDGDGVADLIDANGDGTPESPYVTLNRLQTQFFYDPTNIAGGGDLSKAHFWGTGSFMLAYGENADTATTSTPSLDLGYVGIPSTDFVSLVLTVSKSVSPQVVPIASGSQATFTIKVNSQKYTVDGVAVTDYLPPNWQYVNDSTTILQPDQTLLNGSAANPTITGTGPYTLVWSSTQVGGNMLENQEVTIIFKAQTTTALSPGTLSQNNVKAVGTRTFGSPSQTQTFTATDFTFVASEDVTGLNITKTSVADPLVPGQQFTYTVTVDNQSSSALTGVSIYDPLPAGVSYVASSGSVTCERLQNFRDEFVAVAYTNTNGTVNWSANPWTETDSLGGGAASGLALVTGGVLRLGLSENFLDQFGTAAYTNTNGSTNWSASPWTETDRYGNGATGATGGLVWITGGALQFRYLSTTVIDQFATAAYNNNNGTSNWSDNWIEESDDGSATITGNQHIYITGGSLRFDRATGNTFGIYRDANITGANSITISFSPTDAGFGSGEAVVAEYSVDGGGYTTLGTFDGGTAGWSGNTQTYTISPISGNSIRLRFRATGPWGKNGDEMTIDNVQISYNNAAGTQIQRSVNLTGSTSATLSFSYTAANLDNNDDIIVVEASSNGTTFTTLETFNGAIGTGTRSYNLNSYISATTTIRFRVTSGFNAANETFSIDNVDITYQRTPTAIQRTANLTGALNPQLNYTATAANLEAGDTLVVEASSSASGPFTTLATYAGGTPSVAPPYDLTSYVSANTTIRFRITGGYDVTNETFSFDNVDISYYQPGTFTSNSPPDFLSNGTGGCRIQPGNSLTLTYNVTVDNPLATGIDKITNTAYINCNEIILPLSASVTNIVVNPSSQSATVGDRVWFDSNGDGVLDVGEPGLANVEVTLKDRYGTPLMTTTTDATGHYLFTGIKPGNGYYVEATSVTLPSGLQQSAPVGHSDNRTNAFNLTNGQSYLDGDLGYRSAPGYAAVGNIVWSDANSNGTHNAGEAGLGGVTVELFADTNNNGVFDSGIDISWGTTTTAPDGSYLFTGVPASGTEDYFVYVNGAQANLTGYTTRTTPANDPLYINNLSAGDVVQYANFGYHGTTYSITDRVWFDANGNGSDSGETGIALVTVELLDTSLHTIASTTTDANGIFTFSGVKGGGADYTIRITDTNSKLTDYFWNYNLCNFRFLADTKLNRQRRLYLYASFRV